MTTTDQSGSFNTPANDYLAGLDHSGQSAEEHSRKYLELSVRMFKQEFEEKFDIWLEQCPNDRLTASQREVPNLVLPPSLIAVNALSHCFQLLRDYAENKIVPTMREDHNVSISHRYQIATEHLNAILEAILEFIETDIIIRMRDYDNSMMDLTNRFTSVKDFRDSEKMFIDTMYGYAFYPIEAEYHRLKAGCQSKDNADHLEAVNGNQQAHPHAEKGEGKPSELQSTKEPAWRFPGMPTSLINLAELLEKQPNKTMDKCGIKKEITTYASTLRARCPKWRWWLKWYIIEVNQRAEQLNNRCIPANKIPKYAQHKLHNLPIKPGNKKIRKR